MTNLILIRHSITGDETSQSLSEEGRVRCVPLADAIRAYSPSHIFTSTMRRASETGALVAERLGIGWSEIPGLEEHKRDYEASAVNFQKRMRAFFSTPNARVFGYESANEAELRLRGVLEQLVNIRPGETVAAVSHGTLMSAFLANATQRDGFKIWSSLRRPAFAVLTVPDFRLLRLVEEVPGKGRTK